jgi:hypothetical protein
VIQLREQHRKDDRRRDDDNDRDNGPVGKPRLLRVLILNFYFYGLPTSRRIASCFDVENLPAIVRDYPGIGLAAYITLTSRQVTRQSD